MKVKPWIIYLLASIALFVVAYFIYPYFYTFSLWLLGDITIVATQPNTLFYNQVLFAITYASIPLMIALTNFLFQMKGQKRYFVLIAMLVSSLIFGGWRIYTVRTFYAEHQASYGELIHLQYPAENLQIVTFLFIGAMIGVVIGAVLLKKQQKKIKG